MSETSKLIASPVRGHPGPGAAVLQRMMRRLAHGRLTITLPNGTQLTHRGPRPGADARLTLHNWRPLRAFLRGGDTGFAESYMAGHCSTPDLVAFLRFGAENMAGINASASGAWGARLLARLRHWANRNSREGSRRNIMAHYDLGNNFYAHWLDDQMIYSSALFATPDDTLEAAQARKLARITDLLHAQPGAKILEIGCGWGALATRLGEEGAHVTGLTLSPAQAVFARDRLAAAGLEKNCEIALRDYREETGVYDHIVSIEMLEAVGEDYWPLYFAALRDRLKRGGRAVLQVITIAEERFESYRRSPDFIQSHIFPGGMLPTKTAIAREAQKAGLRLSHSEYFGPSYTRTLAHWQERFSQSWPAIADDTGFTPSFRRLWDYYLAYCMAGFTTGMTDVGFYVLEHAP